MSIIQEVAEPQTTNLMSSRKEAQLFQKFSNAATNPDLAVLSHGSSSMKRILLPLGKDQMDNALRLEDCGIKNRFHIEYIKPKCLRYFINQVLQDYQSLLNLKKMSSEFRLAEKAHLSARKIAHLVENDNLNNFNEHDSAAENWCSTYNAEYNDLDV